MGTVRVIRNKEMMGLAVTLNVVVNAYCFAQLNAGQYVDLEISEDNKLKIWVTYEGMDYECTPLAIHSEEAPVFECKWERVFWDKGRGLMKNMLMGNKPRVHLEKVGTITGPETKHSPGKVFDFTPFEAHEFMSDLTNRVVEIFNGQGVIDRIQSPDNAGKDVFLDFYDEYLTVSYRPVQTHGAKQWATGLVEEKIYYEKDLGMRVPALPPNWKELTKAFAIYDIVHKGQAGLTEDKYGGLGFGGVHSLL